VPGIWAAKTPPQAAADGEGARFWRQVMADLKNRDAAQVAAELRKVTEARGHFPADDAAVKLLWLAIVNIEDKRTREREARRRETGKRSDQPQRLIEGQRVTGWRGALNELARVYPGHIR
jgi:transposase-like protein